MASNPGSSSTIANNVAQRRKVNQTRKLLGLGSRRFATQTPSQAPATAAPISSAPPSPPPGANEAPATAPQQMIASAAETPVEESGGPEIPNIFPTEVRSQLQEMAEAFVQEMRNKRRAQLHQKLGRSRRFFGGG